MPPKSQQPTTAEQQKFIIQWLSILDNRLACFGGAGAKTGYGGKMVVKPATAYNALAQAVNKKFAGTQWDGDSAKSRVRTMKLKFHTVFTLCGGNVQEESAVWKLSDADKRDGILTLADKAQSMCPHWFSWLEWCGTDPNLSKHGVGESGLAASIFASLSSEASGAVSAVASLSSEASGAVSAGLGAAGAADEGSGGSGDDDDANSKGDSDESNADDVNAGAGLGAFARARQAQGDEGHVADDDNEIPRAVTAKVAPAPGHPGDADDLQEQKRKRKEMLSQMTAEEKKDLARHEQKEKRQRELEASSNRRGAVASAASPSAGVNSPPASGTTSSSVSSPFAKGGLNKDWQANFLVDRARDEEARAEKQAAAQVTVAKLQIAASDRHYEAELSHKREQLSFQQQQLTFQQQQLTMQMQMQQTQQAM